MTTAYEGHASMLDFMEHLQSTGDEPKQVEPAPKEAPVAEKKPETVLDQLAAVEAELAVLPASPQVSLDRLSELDRQIKLLEEKNARRRTELATMKLKDFSDQTLGERLAARNLVDNIFKAQDRINQMENEYGRIREEMAPLESRRRQLNSRRLSLTDAIGEGMVMISHMLRFLYGLGKRAQLEELAAKEAAERTARRAEIDARRAEIDARHAVTRAREIEDERATRDQRHFDHKERQRAEQEAAQARRDALRKPKVVAPPPSKNKKKAGDDKNGKPKKK